MMTNLLTFASLAKKTTQLLSTVARLRLLLVMLLTLCVSAEVWAETATFTANSYGWTNGQLTGDPTTKTIGDVTFKFAGGSTKPTYYTADGLRTYEGCKITISSEATISSIAFTYTINNSGSLSATPGTWNSSTKKWSGSANTVTFTVGHSSGTKNGQIRITQIAVTYTPAVSCTNPTIATQPTGATYTKGATATALKVVASGDDLTYQWYSNTSNSTSGATAINGATNTTYTPSTSTVGTKYYYCIVSSGSCSTTSNIVSVVVKNPPFTVTLNAGSGSCAASVTESSSGAGVELPTPTLTGCDEWTFAGWATSAVATETSSKPATLLTGTYKPTANTTLYAVYQRTEETEGNGGTENVSRSYTFSEYTAGAQYAEGEEHVLDDVLTLTTTQCHFTSELRIYSSDTHNGYVVSNQLPGRIISIGFNAGNKVDKIAVYGSTNGTAWTEVGQVSVTSTSYANYSLSFGETNYTYFKLDVVGSNQVRLKSMTITWESTTAGGTTTTTYYYSNPDCATQTLPSMTASVSSLAFGNVTVNQSSQKTFTLSGSNLTADATLALSGTNAGLFSVTPLSVTPTDGSITNETITVTYTPTAKASHSATLTISSTDAESIEISLSGTGVAQMANYTVKHYQQNLDGTYPTEPTETEYPSGEVGTNVTPAVKTYEGFTAPSTTEVTIAADGKTVVEYYYTRNSYNLTWDVNEGNDLTGEYTSGSVKFGATITKPADPTRENHNFKGWKDQNGSTVVASTMPANDLTYTAQWKERYTVTWLVEGQPYTIGNPTTTVEDGQNITAIPSDPPLLTCAVKFMGWSIESSGSTPKEPTYYRDLFTTLAEAQAISIEENTIFHAVFAMTQSGTQSETITTEKSSFTATSGTLDDNISYNSYTGDAGSAPALSNGAIRLYQVSSDTKTGGYIVISAATGSITSASITSTETYASSYTGYILDYTKTYTPDKDDFEVNDYTLYKGQTYTVSGLDNSAIAFACFSTNSNYRLEIAKISVTYTKEGAPSYTDYVTSCCETPAPTNGAYENITGSDNAMSVTLTWEGSASRYHITGGNLNAEGEYTNQTSHTISGLTECNEYTFYVSAYPADGCESSAIEIGVTPYIQKTVTFVDGTTTTTQTTSCTSKTVIVPTPTAQNCSTYVWIDEATGTEYTDGQTITPANDMTIVAKWSVETYTITFNDWNGTQLQQSTVECGQTPAYNGETPTRPENNTHQYTFAGWTPTIVPANSDATYTATYTQTQHQITVTWMVNGEEYTEGEPSNMVLAGEKVAKLPTPPSPDDYCGQVFAGWTNEPIDEVNDNIPSILFTTPDASPTIYKEDDNATITFYAVFANIVE